MQKITPMLWFKDNAAEEAANYYVSVIKGSKDVHEQCWTSKERR